MADSVPRKSAMSCSSCIWTSVKRADEYGCCAGEHDIGGAASSRQVESLQSHHKERDGFIGGEKLDEEYNVP